MSQDITSALLGVASVKCFLEDSWERRPLVARSTIQGSIGDVLSQERFEQLLASGAPGLSIVEHHVARPVVGPPRGPPPFDAIVDSYRRGCTLLQSAVQRLWPPVARLCRELESSLIAHGLALSDEIGANAYMSPADSSGFGLHYDDHCALVLQLDGRKHWTVFSPIEELPVGRCERMMERDELGPPLLETELGAGDVLYVPRGFPHVARCGAASSLHLTMSLRTVTWLEILGSMCCQRVEFRRSVPPHREPHEAREHFERVLAPLLLGVDAAQAVRQRRQESPARLRPLAGGRLRAIDESKPLTADTPVERAAGVCCHARLEGDEAVLRFPGRTVRLPAVMQPVFEFLATHHHFTPKQLPAVAASYDAERLVEALIAQGLLCPSRTDGRE